MGNIVEIRNLTKVFEDNGKSVVALDNINLDIEEGNLISIIGGSGCGKSTMLRIIGGLETQYEGEVLVDGKSVYKPSREKGFIFQDHRLLPWLTVKENIRFSLPETQKNNNALIKENLELVGLSEFENAYPKQLSGGMAQRVAIARALANKPKILLLDEPFGALDAITKINLQEQLLNIWQKEKITMVIVTHDIDEAIYLGNKVVVMTTRPGRIEKIMDVDLGTPRRRTGPLFNVARDAIYREFFKDTEIPIEYSI
ncbi:ABC transporter ATP-binding protein [Aminipila butyrica]|uniref:ABC transporter ATP-binding protein n=1 Tax=Aminipila butyrica TaxID=433296 RepID=A0A858BSD5_9FIRM|nr:ABC transporter ATP-binding protein [Aminipila butyrica]QIB68025.1 ABC transporter ATP-binding protein [Aminipila butyrica]